MPNDAGISVRVRLEDAVALAFFFLYLALAVIFREMRQDVPDPVNLLIVVPAVCLLLVKELVQYFVAGKDEKLESPEGIREFIRPYWTILRDWLPFFVLL